MRDETGSGVVEEAFLKELLTIVSTRPQSEYQQILREKTSYPYIYHLSELRSNVIDWLPMDKSMSVLEIGAECGALTKRLAEKAGRVTYVTDSQIQSQIIRARISEEQQENVIGHYGSYASIKNKLESYDKILLVGSLGYAKDLLENQSEAAYQELLVDLKRHLKPEGELVIADANRIGLKYFAGCQEEYRKSYFTGLEAMDTEGARSFTRKELERLMKAAGYEHSRFYYPYPDFRFMTTLYSDAYLPKPGELGDNLRNLDRDRLQLFDERRVFDTLIQEGLFPEFSNSFLVRVW